MVGMVAASKLEAPAPDVRAPGIFSKPFCPSDWLIKQKRSFLSPGRDWLFHFLSLRQHLLQRLHWQVKVTSQRHKASGLIRKDSAFTFIFKICLNKQHFSPRQLSLYFKMPRSTIKIQSKAGVNEEFMAQGSKVFLGSKGKYLAIFIGCSVNANR